MLRVLLAVFFVALLSTVGFSRIRDSERVYSPLQNDQAFADVTEAAGISWRHFSGESSDRFLIETMGGGVAFLDFDNDGLLDILFVNGGETPRRKSATPVRNALYRNLGKGNFEDVAAKAGIDKLDFYGML